MAKHIDKNFFDENGYVVIDNAFSEEEIQSFRTALDQLLSLTLERARREHPDRNIPKNVSKLETGFEILNSINPEYISFIQRIFPRTNNLYQTCSGPRITHAVKTLMDIPENIPLYFTSTGVIFTNPCHEDLQAYDINTNWHLDTYYTIPQSRFIHIWAPFYHTSTPEIGTLVLCPGSNKIDPCDVPQKFNPSLGYNDQYYIEEKDVSRYEHRSIEVDLGQALIFDSRTIHRSGKNVSDKIRCTLISLCHDIRKPEFAPVVSHYKYSRITPEHHFAITYNDRNAGKHAMDHALTDYYAGGV